MKPKIWKEKGSKFWLCNREKSANLCFTETGWDLTPAGAYWSWKKLAASKVEQPSEPAEPKPAELW